MTYRTSVVLTLCTFALALAAQPTAAQSSTEFSGFLSDYSRLAVDPGEPDARLMYKNPDYPFGSFEKLYLEPLVFYLYPQDQAEAIDAEEAAKMLALSKRFDEVFREEIAAEGANLVDQPGPGVLHCRWAVTNLGKTKSVTRVLPQARLVMGVGLGKGRGAAAMEGECLDGSSGEIVAQIIRADKGKKSSGVTTWAGAESAVRKWARDLAKRIAAERSGG